MGTTGQDGTHTWTRANTGLAGNFHTVSLTEMFPSNDRPRVKAVAALRTPNAPNTGAAAHLADAQLAATLAVDTPALWFS